MYFILKSKEQRHLVQHSKSLLTSKELMLSKVLKASIPLTSIVRSPSFPMYTLDNEGKTRVFSIVNILKEQYENKTVPPYSHIFLENYTVNAIRGMGSIILFFSFKIHE